MCKDFLGRFTVKCLPSRLQGTGSGFPHMQTIELVTLNLSEEIHAAVMFWHCWRVIAEQQAESLVGSNAVTHTASDMTSSHY